MAGKPQILITSGNALLLAGVGALLHNVGKVNPKFIESKATDDKSQDYLYQHILRLIIQDWPNVGSTLPEFSRRLFASDNQDVVSQQTGIALTQRFNLPPPLHDRPYCPGDLIEYLGQGSLEGAREDQKKLYDDKGIRYILQIFPNGSRLTHLMQRAHRGASGGEKEGIWTKRQLGPDDLYRATPMGWEVPAPNQVMISNLQKEVEQIIQNYLLAPNMPFPIQEFANELRPLLNQAIADTRRPLNDVTVWDIGLSGMAFLLTQAIGLIAHQRPIDHNELAKTDKNTSLFWRVLGLRTDGFDFLNNAPTLADLRVRYRLMQKSLDKVRRTLETMPVAVEIYRDENGSFFIFPDLPEQDYRIVQQALEPDLLIDGLRLAPILSEKLVNAPKDTGGDYIGDYIQQQIMSPELPRSHQPDAYTQVWQEAVAEICVACGIRPQGYGADSEYYREKAISRHLCYQCMKERSGIAEQWVQALNESTVWIDEVADENGRAALLVGSLGIEVFVPSIVYPGDVQEQKYPELQVNFLGASPPDGHEFLLTNRNIGFSWNATKQLLIGPVGTNIPTKFQNNGVTIHYPRKVEVTIQDITFDGSEFVLKLQENLTLSGLAKGDDITCWGQDFVVTGNQTIRTNSSAAKDKVATSILWGDGTYLFTVIAGTQKEIAELKVGARSQSFARLRRVWETTRHFWQEVLPIDKDNDVVQSVAGTVVGLTGPRLEIRGTLNQNDPLGLFHTYELVLGPTRLSVVWDPEERRLITCDNLKYLAEPEQLGQGVKAWLDQHKGQPLVIEEPVSYGSKNKEWGTITVERVDRLPGSYMPVVPILAEPRTFMALIPADKALAVVDAIRQKYEREMGKVRNRLPLHLGVVYFHRRTPLRAALDAGRRMLQQKSLGGEAPWTVQGKQCGDLPTEVQSLPDGTLHFKQCYVVRLAQNGRELTWYVPAMMGDGQTEDQWYPYVFIETNHDDSKVNGRKRAFKGLRPTANGVEACWLVHMADLEEGDQVYFIPATFDFEWLDTTARRFEIAYNDDGRRCGRLARPYLLDELQMLNGAWKVIGGENGLSNNQIYALRDLIEAKREIWLENQVQDSNKQPDSEVTFHQLCRDAILNAEWTKVGRDNLFKPWPINYSPHQYADQPVNLLEHLANWAANGLLTDVIELRMSIVKEQSQRSQTGKETKDE
jgi:hypothetical protein